MKIHRLVKFMHLFVCSYCNKLFLTDKDYDIDGCLTEDEWLIRDIID